MSLIVRCDVNPENLQSLSTVNHFIRLNQSCKCKLNDLVWFYKSMLYMISLPLLFVYEYKFNLKCFSYVLNEKGVFHGKIIYKKVDICKENKFVKNIILWCMWKIMMWNVCMWVPGS